MAKSGYNTAHFTGKLDKNGNCTNNSIRGGDSSISSYGVTSRNNWVVRANKRPLVVTRTQANG